jgi:hypothetical protein
MNRETVRPESFLDEALFILDEVDEAPIFSIEPKRLFPSFAKNGKETQSIRELIMRLSSKISMYVTIHSHTSYSYLLVAGVLN